MQATFQLDLDNVTEVLALKELLEQRLTKLLSEDGVPNTLIEPSGTSSIGSNEQNTLQILQQFINGSSSKQLDVLKWMKANPGSISAHILKMELPFLAPHGALSGVFRPGRWERLSGGSKDGFPFLQIGWNREEGCGIYRGLTQEEANLLNI